MKIGIDATALPQEPVGAGVYIINLLRALGDLNTGYELVVFLHENARNYLEMDETTNILQVVLPEKNPALRLVWEQIMLPKLVKRYKIDLLHSLHYTSPFLLACASVVTIHDLTFFLFPELHKLSKRLFFPSVIRASARKADALITVSENTRQDSIRLLHVPEEKIFAVQLGVDEIFHPIKDNGLRRKIYQQYQLPEKFILYVGLVEPRKNLPLLIRSFRTLVEEGFSHRLVIVGRLGWMYQEVFKQIETLGLEDRIKFTGYVPRQNLPIVYNLAELFVYPTLYEGFGLPVLEAMACGTPVVTSKISSLPEIVGNAGILVTPGEESALAEAMVTVLSDPKMQENLAEKGIIRSKDFSWKRTAKETLQVYQHVLKM
jgi:glycosyltransferase involved in cell wall biosynthesis